MISVVARSNHIIKQLVLEAKRGYEKDAEHRVHIFLADTYVLVRRGTFYLLTRSRSRRYGNWRWTGAKQKRPMSSIVLEPSVKEMLVEDCKDFLRSEDW
jgi:chaperone BCS1